MTKRSAKDLANDLEDALAYDLGMKIVEKYEEAMLNMLETLQKASDIYFDEDHGRRGSAALREDFARAYRTGAEKGLRKSKKLCAAYEDAGLEGAEDLVKDLFERVKAKK